MHKSPLPAFGYFNAVRVCDVCVQKYASNNSPSVTTGIVGRKKAWFPRSPALPSGSRKANHARAFGHNLTNTPRLSQRRLAFEHGDGTPDLRTTDQDEELSPGAIEAGILGQPFTLLGLDDGADSSGGSSLFPGERPSVCAVSPAVRVWVPDHSVSRCFECEGLFSLANRKHHCRKCGRIYCGQCCAHFVSEAQIGFDKFVDPGRGPKDALTFLVCRRCYARCVSRVSSFHALSAVENRAAQMRILSFLSPMDIGRVAMLSSEWHGLMVSKVADAALWRPLCRRRLGRVLSTVEYRAAIEQRSAHNNMPPHQDLYVRYHLLAHNVHAAAQSLASADISMVLAAASALMNHFSTMVGHRGVVPNTIVRAITPLVQMVAAYIHAGMVSAEQKDALISATGALMNGALLGDDVRQEFLRLDGLALMVAVLDEDLGRGTKLSKYAAGALWNLTMRDSTCRITVVRHIPSIVDHLRAYCTDPPGTPHMDAAIVACAGTLASSCTEKYHANQKALFEAGGIEVLALLVRQLLDNDSRVPVLVGCCTVLRNAIIGQPDAQRVLRESGGVPMLFDMVDPLHAFFHRHEKVSKSAINILLNMSAEDRCTCEEIDLETVLGMLEKHATVPHVALGCAAIFQNATVHSPRVEECVCFGIVRCAVLYTTLAADNVEVQTCLLRMITALFNLTLNRRNRAPLVAAGATEALQQVKIRRTSNSRYFATKALEVLEKHTALKGQQEVQVDQREPN